MRRNLQRGNKKRSSKVAREVRTSRAILMLRTGSKLKDVARVLGISRDTLWRNLRSLGDEYQAENCAAIAEKHRADIEQLVAVLIRRAYCGDVRAIETLERVLDGKEKNNDAETA